MISNTYNRYLWLLNTLLQYKRLTLKEICEKWAESYFYEGKPLNSRTFHVHRKAVEEMFQVSIVCDPVDGYSYYIEDAASLEKNKARQWLLNSFNVSNMVNEGKRMKDRILLEDIPEGTGFLQTIIQAMLQGKVLEVEYQPFYENERKCYRVRPYCMKVYHQRWYVLGWFEEQKGLRHLSLDRTVSVSLTDETFEYPKDFSPEGYYQKSIGIWVDDGMKPEKIVLRAYGSQSKYLRSLPLHKSQKIISETADYSDFEYYICVTPDLVNELLQKGESVEVLEPENLRQQIRDSAMKILNRYNADLVENEKQNYITNKYLKS